MPNSIGQAYIQILPTTKGLGAAISKEMTPQLDAAGIKAGEETGKRFGEGFSKKLSSVGQGMKKVGGTMSATVTAPLMAGFGLAINAASDFDENINKVTVAFDGCKDKVIEWSKTATAQFGLSQNAALEMTALFGDMGTSMGLSKNEAAEMSMNLAGLAGDLASFKNIDVGQAMTALNGVFTGETESLKTLGVVMTETNLEKFAADTGKVYKEMDEAEKVQLRYNYVWEKTKNAHGDYSETSDQTANSLRTMKESLNNLAVVFGQQLLPVITPVIQKITGLIQKFGELSPRTQKIILIVAGALALAGPLLVAIGTIVSAIGAISAAGMVAMGPLLIIVGAIAAGIAIGVLLYKNWDKIKAKAVQLKAKLVAVFNSVKEKITIIWNAIKTTIQNKINQIKETIGRIKSLVQTVGNAFSRIKDKIITPINTAKDKVKGIIDKIKGFFNIKIHFPHVPYPHFSITPAGWKVSDLLEGSIPHLSIQTYESGAIMTDPTTFHIGGEAGAEGIIPLKPFWDKLDKYLAAGSGGGTLQIVINLDGKTIGQSTIDYINGQTIMFGTAPVIA